ncbi:hypothetical protein ACPRNU_05095 [Chromobacterium vaccinii]|uniref:hypothetical protein n=1 Tax=Chromobacterium vaccinii TaxID=1108595 RepID=UPI003C70FA3D
MTAKQRKLLLLGVALLVFGALKFGLIYWYLHKKPAAPAAQRLSCAVADGAVCPLPGGGGLRFETAPAHGQPFVMRLDGAAAETAPTADFTMPQMDMGFNRYTFVREGAGWRATATLPMCVSGSRRWQVEVKLGDKAYLLPFDVR